MNKRLSKLITEIERKVKEVACDNIDFSEQIDDRFCTCESFAEVGNVIVHFEFDAHDTRSENIELEWITFEQVLNSKSKELPNITNYLNRYFFEL